MRLRGRGAENKDEETEGEEEETEGRRGDERDKKERDRDGEEGWEKTFHYYFYFMLNISA